jgi:hypothetical protein
VPTPIPAPAPAPAPDIPPPWSPDRSKLLVVPQLRQGPYTVTVPPADYLIIPISVGEYERLVSWGWNAYGKTEGSENYLDSWMVDSNGVKVSESGRTFNCGLGFVGGSLGPGTYYIYLSNEFTSFSAKDVALRVRWE